MFKNLTQLAQLLRNATHLSDRVRQMKQRLTDHRFERANHDRTVVVEMNGLGKVQDLTIDAACLSPERKKHVEEQVTVAINAGMREARRLHIEALRELTAGMNILDFDELIKELDD